jgi:CBS domain-containing protein
MITTLEVLIEGKGSLVVSGKPTDSIFDCVMLMKNARIGSLLIMKGDKILGMFTERDLMQTVIPERLDMERTPVSDVMNRDVICVPPSTTTEEAMSIMTEKRVRHLPVIVDAKLLGLVSIGDVTKWLSDSHRQKIQEIDDLVHYINGGYSA